MHSEIHEYHDKPRKLYTLIYPIDLDKGRVILGYKRRGFGVGKCMFQFLLPWFNLVFLSFYHSLPCPITRCGISKEHCADCN